MTLHIRCPKCDLVDIVTKDKSLEWICPSCRFTNGEKIYLYKIYIDNENFVETWADNIIENDKGALIFMINGSNVAGYKIWTYWFWTGQCKEKQK